MSKLTPEEVQDYVDNFGTYCPYCESENIDAGNWDIGTGQFWQIITCHSCNKKWTDVYTLTGLDEREE
jgi:transposase-like protein